MNTLVTGAAGFVGSSLCQELLRRGHHVIGIDSLSDYYDPAIKRSNLASLVSGRFSFVHADLNQADLTALLDGVQWVFHQAGQPGVRKSWGRDFSIYSRQNIEATQKLLEAARHSPSLRRLVYASSSSVYGNAERYPTLETDRPRPVSPYGVSKLAAEHLCSLYASNFDVPTVSLRYFTVYGPRQRTDMAFTRFVRSAVLDQPISIFGTGEQVRDFTYISDVVDANILAADRDVPAGSVFNVAGGSNITVNQTLAIIQEFVPRPLRVRYQNRVAGDVYRTGGDTTLILDTIGWQAQVGIRDGLASHLSWGQDVFGQAAADNLAASR